MTPSPGQTVIPVDLIRFLQERLAHFMVPKYVRVIPELPKTHAEGAEGGAEDAGITSDTWDATPIRRSAFGARGLDPGRAGPLIPLRPVIVPPCGRTIRFANRPRIWRAFSDDRVAYDRYTPDAPVNRDGKPSSS